MLLYLEQIKCNELNQCPITGQCEIIKPIKAWQFFRLDVCSCKQTQEIIMHTAVEFTITNWNFH